MDQTRSDLGKKTTTNLLTGADVVTEKLGET